MIMQYEDWTPDDLPVVLARAVGVGVQGRRSGSPPRIERDCDVWSHILTYGVFGKNPPCAYSFALAEARGTAACLLRICQSAPHLVWHSPAVTAVLDMDAEHVLGGLEMRRHLVKVQAVLLLWMWRRRRSERSEAAKRASWRLLAMCCIESGIDTALLSQLVTACAAWELEVPWTHEDDAWSDDDDGAMGIQARHVLRAKEVEVLLRLFRSKPCVRLFYDPCGTLCDVVDKRYASFATTLKDDLDAWELVRHVEQRFPQKRFPRQKHDPWTDLRASWIGAVAAAALAVK